MKELQSSDEVEVEGTSTAEMDMANSSGMTVGDTVLKGTLGIVSELWSCPVVGLSRLV